MKVKIIATIGPSSQNPKVLKAMVSSGMDIARINTKYGSVKQYLQITDRLDKIGGCKTLYDIKGTEMIPWLTEQKFDYLAVSFAETPAQIKEIRKTFNPKKIRIISKIETERGIRNIGRLIDASDGIMVARGDLGRNIPLEDVPIEQKMIIKKCNRKKKTAITATEMLLSMTDSKIPERAEVSDVANAVLDGSDALMLSEETAIGKYPVLAVKTMNKIINATEKRKHLLKNLLKTKSAA